MRIRLCYHAQIRQAAGVESEEADCAPGADVIEALKDAIARHGHVFHGLVLADDGKIRPSLIVLVNSVPVPHGTRRSLADGDEISVFSAVAGG